MDLRPRRHGVALISFILLAVWDDAKIKKRTGQTASLDFRYATGHGDRQRLAYVITMSSAKSALQPGRKMNFETPLKTLVWLASIISIIGDFHWRHIC